GARWYLRSFPTRRSSDLRDTSANSSFSPQISSTGVSMRATGAVRSFFRSARYQWIMEVSAFGSFHALRYCSHSVFSNAPSRADRSEEHTSELQSRENLVC